MLQMLKVLHVQRYVCDLAEREPEAPELHRVTTAYWALKEGKELTPDQQTLIDSILQ